MAKNLTWQKITLNLRNPFRLSYGTSERREAYIIRLRDDTGWGEGTIPPYYGVNAEKMVEVWQRAAEKSASFPDDPALIPDWIGEEGPAPARCALDIALHDRIARLKNVPLHALLDAPQPKPQNSSFTIALDTPEAMAKMSLRVARTPIIKVKLGGDGLDLQRLSAIRKARPDVVLWVDANAAWSRDAAEDHLPDLEALGIEMIEQPLEKADIVGMGILQSKTKIPIVADESVQTLTNIEDLAGAGMAGVNIKLMKVGGISPAMTMIRRAKTLGLRIMLGCMIETAIGTTAMAHLAGYAEWLDLDASALITNDPFEGMVLDETCTVKVPDRPGIGVGLQHGYEWNDLTQKNL